MWISVMFCGGTGLGDGVIQEALFESDAKRMIPKGT
jgi:hypothetical protein